MRILGLAILILLVSYIIKVDLLDGTISLAAFSKEEPICTEDVYYEVFPVQTVMDDTIFSLFAVYPSEIWVSFPERLEAFYQENPHYRNQTLQPYETVQIPIFKKKMSACSEK
ncbi:MAG: hypothetical protein ABWX61_07055 [Paenisporosarcina sp.]